MASSSGHNLSCRRPVPGGKEVGGAHQRGPGYGTEMVFAAPGLGFGAFIGSFVLKLKARVLIIPAFRVRFAFKGELHI